MYTLNVLHYLTSIVQILSITSNSGSSQWTVAVAAFHDVPEVKATVACNVTSFFKFIWSEAMHSLTTIGVQYCQYITLSSCDQSFQLINTTEYFKWRVIIDLNEAKEVIFLVSCAWLFVLYIFSWKIAYTCFSS